MEKRGRKEGRKEAERAELSWLFPLSLSLFSVEELEEESDKRNEIASPRSVHVTFNSHVN